MYRFALLAVVASLVSCGSGGGGSLPNAEAQDDVSGRLTDLESRQGDLEVRQGDADARVTDLESRQGDAEARFDALEQEIADAESRLRDPGFLMAKVLVLGDTEDQLEIVAIFQFTGEVLPIYSFAPVDSSSLLADNWFFPDASHPESGSFYFFVTDKEADNPRIARLDTSTLDVSVSPPLSGLPPGDVIFLSLDVVNTRAAKSLSGISRETREKLRKEGPRRSTLIPAEFRKLSRS